MLSINRFKILTIGPFSFKNAGEREVVRDFPGAIQEAMPETAVSLSIPMEKKICEQGCLALSFTGLADFSPPVIVNNHSWLFNLKSAVDYISSAMDEGRSAEEIHQRLTSWESLPFHFPLPERSKAVPAPDAGSSPLDDILNMVESPEREGRSAGTGPLDWKTAINDLLEQNLAAVLRHPDFIRTSAAWHGLNLLADACAGSGDLFLQTLSISTETLDNLGTILRREFSREAPNLALIDFAFDSTHRSLGIIKAVAAVCEEFLVPAVIAVNEHFLHLSAWKDVPSLPYLPHYLEEVRFAEWKGFAASPASPAAGWLAATCIPFQVSEENRDKNLSPVAERGDLPLLSPVWALGALCVRSIRTCGWPTRFADDSCCRLKNSAALFVLSPETAADFSKAGFLPLCSETTGETVFFQADKTVAGTSFAYQLLVARMVSFFLDLNSRTDKKLLLESQELQVRKAWDDLWGKTGSGQPCQSSVRLTRDNTGQPLLKVSFVPPETVLPQRSPIEFDLLW